MTERCQTKFKEKTTNRNYFIYIAIGGAIISVFYFYRFHFVTIVFSYALGCLACYYSLKYCFLNKYIDKLKYNLITRSEEQETNDVLTKGCKTCGSKECARHDSRVDYEPWAGLRVHKQLDQAIEDFYNTILDHFVNSWYSKISLQPFFIDELRHQLRYASSCLLRRAVKINYASFITEGLVPCALRHYSQCAGDGGVKLAVHPAAANRHAELRYLRAITNAVMPYLLKEHDLKNSVFQVLIREIFAGWVLLSLTDVLADPYILNTLIILATGDETMAQLPTTPNYRVEFLETFVRQTDSVYTQRSKLLKIDLDYVLNDQDYFYAFMQYMKTTSNIHLLQFYKDIKTFQTKILNPELKPKEEILLTNEAWDIYVTYFDISSPSYVQLDPTLGDELRLILKDVNGSVKRLQTSRALYQAARQSHDVLEKVMLPKFLHSDEFYRIIIGPRIPVGYNKQMTKKPQEKYKLTNRLKLKHQTIDGQVLESISNSSTDVSDTDSVDNMDILKYIDTLAENGMREDLSTFKVVLTDVQVVMQPPPRRGPVRVFSVTAHGGRPPRLWTLDRSEHDFHLLRSKMLEFHGEKLLLDLPLPSRRDNSPLETLRYKYEDFLQRLLQKTILQSSELLHLFLTVEGDFSHVVQASSLTGTTTDLTNIYQSVTHKLRKEKGQHLESFLKNFLVSTDLDRFQVLKPGAHIEEALEVNEDIVIENEFSNLQNKRNGRSISSPVFEDNFGLESVVTDGCDVLQDKVAGFTHCLMYLLIKVINAHTILTGIVGSILSLARELFDDVFNTYLNFCLRNLLTERRLAHLIRLGQSILFGKKSSPREDPDCHRDLARKQLVESLPPSLTAVVGSGLTRAVNNAFDVIQRPQYNKQLVYNLLDLCVRELFPEMEENSEENKPKS